jgi:GxxExxY protein
MLYSEMTDKIINSFYKVYNVLGYGFLEKVYENSLVIELKSPMKEGKYQKQKPQIRVNPRNPRHPRHPRSIRLVEYYILYSIP